MGWPLRGFQISGYIFRGMPRSLPADYSKSCRVGDEEGGFETTAFLVSRRQGYIPDAPDAPFLALRYMYHLGEGLTPRRRPTRLPPLFGLSNHLIRSCAKSSPIHRRSSTTSPRFRFIPSLPSPVVD